MTKVCTFQGCWNLPTNGGQKIEILSGNFSKSVLGGGQQSLAPPSNLSYNLQSLSSKLPSIEELLIFEKIIKCNNIKGMLREKVGKSSRGGSSPP